jgi:thiamine kinase-like enzyme
VLHVDPGRGLMLTRHVEGRTMTPALFREPGAAGRAAAALGRLHRSGARFAFRFELFAMIEDYLKVLTGLDAVLPEGYHAAVAEAEAVRAALEAHPAALAPCHCDPLCENFLDTGERMWIVDWEYSGMNDPLWDLGDLAVEGAFGPAQEEEMLAAYFGRPPGAAERGRVVAYKAMCDLLWTLWGLIQHANRNPADDFWAYATNRFARCRRLMASEGFAGHLAAVRAG